MIAREKLAKPSGAGRGRRRFLLPPGVRAAASALLLLGVTCLAYYPAITKAGFVWDDDQYVTANPMLRSARGLERIWTEPAVSPQYYPLVFTTFWAERHLWGLHPLGYHLVNVLLHAGSAIVLWRLLRRLGVPGALLAAGIFALHPVHAESVAWITERKNVLSGLLFLLSLAAYLRFHPPQEWLRTGPGFRKTRLPWYALSVLLLAGALLSKSVTATLGGLILVLVWWKTGRLTRRDWMAVVPLLVLGAAAGWNTARLEQVQVGATGEDWGFGIVERLLIAGRALWFYVAKLLWPFDLAFTYERWTIDAREAWQYLFPAAVVAVLAAFWLLRRRIGRAPLAGALAFCGMLLPALGFFNVYPMVFSFVADHFQYLASLGVIVPLAAGATLLARRRRRAWLAGAGIWAALAGLTWLQCGIYKDTETLWRDTLAKSPDSWMTHNNIGFILLSRGDYPAARRHYDEAVRIRGNDAKLLCDHGTACEMMGDLEQALRDFAKALAIHPDYDTAYAARANAWMVRGMYREGLEDYNRALAANLREHPDHPDPRLYANRGVAWRKLGQLRLSLQDLDRALELEGDYARALCNRGQTFTDLDRPTEALRDLNRAIELEKDDVEAYFARGYLLVGQRRLDEALRDFDHVIAFQGDRADAYFNRGMIWAMRNDHHRAIDQFDEAIRLRPPYAEAYFNRGNSYAALGLTGPAADSYTEAIARRPDWAAAYNNRGGVLSQAGLREPALRDFDMAIKLDPSYADAYANRAMLHLDLGDRQSARRDAVRSRQLGGTLAPELLQGLQE